MLKKRQDTKNSEQKSTRETYVLFSAAVMTLIGFAVTIVGNAVIPSAFLPVDSEAGLSAIVSAVRHSFPPIPLFPVDENEVVSPESVETESSGGSYSTDYVPDGALPVVSLTMEPLETLLNYGGVYINNESKKSVDLKAMTEAEFPINFELNSDKPQVVIYHTHGTEAYNENGLSYYGEEYYSVSSIDTEKNIVHIGEVLADELEKRGIKTLHVTEMFDQAGYTDAYVRSGEAIEELLSKNPSVRLVLDLHRDTVITSEGTKYRPVCKTRYGSTAQLMLLVGSGRDGYENPHWKDNLLLAVKLQQRCLAYSGLMRQIFLRPTRYNQHLSAGSILVEVGTCGNTLKEAENAVRILADIIAG